MLINEFYEVIGGNYEDVKQRLRSDNLIERFAKKFLNEKSYEELMAAAEINDIEASVEAVHKLKGVVANLSFAKLYEASNNLLVQLRQNPEIGIDKILLQDVTDSYKEVIENLNKYEITDWVK